MAVFLGRRVIFKQRDNKFFPPSAYALSLLLVRIPFQLVEAALFTAVVYFWVGAFMSHLLRKSLCVAHRFL